MSVDSATTPISGPELYRAEQSPSFAGRIRSHPVLVAVVVLFVVLVGTLLWTQRPEDYTPLSTENSTPTGTRALAQILRAQGVDVRQASTMADARIQDPAQTTLAVAFSSDLAYYQIEALEEYPGDLVLIEPPQQVLNTLAPDLTIAMSLDATPVTAQCEDPDAVAAESVLATGYALTGDPGPDGHLCFANDADQAAYGVVVDDDGRRIAIIAGGDIVTNG